MKALGWEYISKAPTLGLTTRISDGFIFHLPMKIVFGCITLI